MISFPLKDMNKDEIGAKAFYLYKLKEFGYLVPNFFVVPTSANIDKQVFKNELFKALNGFNGDTYSVRSSATNEDGKAKSFAGQYKTFLNVKKNSVIRCIKEVKKSINNPLKNLYSTSDGEMAVIVQEMIDPEQAGVLFSESIYSKDEISIESVNGVGELLVSGNKTPNSYVYKKEETIDNKLHSQLKEAAIDLEKKMGMPLDIEWAYKDDKLYFLQMRPLTIHDDNVPEIDLRNYELYVKHNFSLFALSIQLAASKKTNQEKLFGFSIPIYDSVIVNGREYYSLDNNNKVIKAWEELDKDDFFEKFINRIYKLQKLTIKNVGRLKKINFEEMSNFDYYRQIRFFIRSYLNSYVPMMMRPDDYLLYKIKQMSSFNDDELRVLLFVDKPTFYNSEYTDFLRACKNHNYKTYLNKYEWIINPLGYDNKTLTKKDLQERIKLLKGIDIKKKIQNINDDFINKVEERNQMLSSIKNDNLLRYINLLREFVYLRTFVVENSDRLFYYLKNTFLVEASKRTNTNLKALLMHEYVDLYSHPFFLLNDAATLMKKKRGYMFMIRDGEISKYYGSQTYRPLSYLNNVIKENDIKGQVACPGEVTGIVKIINDFSDANKMNEGDILVTSMTTPEIAIALSKASGIITDEGGVTCHASIIAREYAIPCLVGTVVATKMLHDGDRIYLDCINGLVKTL